MSFGRRPTSRRLLAFTNQHIQSQPLWAGLTDQGHERSRLVTLGLARLVQVHPFLRTPWHGWRCRSAVPPPGRSDDLSRFSKGRVDPYGGRLLPICCSMDRG